MDCAQTNKILIIFSVQSLFCNHKEQDGSFLFFCPLPHICHSILTKPLSVVWYNTKGMFHCPPASFFLHLCLTYYLSPLSPTLPLASSRFISGILLNPICLFMIYPLQSQSAFLCSCLFSPVLPVLDTVSGTQIMSDIYKTGLARITFPYTHTHGYTLHTLTNE